jgi:hypothetical protein
MTLRDNIIGSIIGAIAFAAAFTGAQLFLNAYNSTEIAKKQDRLVIYSLAEEEENE